MSKYFNSHTREGVTQIGERERLGEGEFQLTHP